MRRIIALCLVLMPMLCCSAYADTLAGYPNLVFPIDNDTVYVHKEGSRFHMLSGLVVQDGKRASDLFALDLAVPGGTSVRPAAEGKVVWLDQSYGYVVVEHNIPITTDSEIINTYVRGKIWYSGYMHMKNIQVTLNQNVNTSTKLGEVSNIHPSATLSDHLHFAVYDKDMYSFSPYLLGEAFRETHVTYKYDFTGRQDFESDKTVNAACLHYWAEQEEAAGRELTEDEIHANIKAKYTGTSTEAWYFSNHYANYRNNDTNTEGGDLTIEIEERVNYSQDWLYESSGSWQNVSIMFDSQGQMYFVVYDSNGSSTYIYRADSSLTGSVGRSVINNFTLLITINGRASVSLSPDETNPYVYYKLDGDDTHLYRMPLGRSSEPEVRDFSMEGNNFVFVGFDLVDYDKILLVSRESSGQVTVGLFSYSDWTSGNNEPSRTWTCTLPSERTYTPLINNEVGYEVRYEAGTDKLWLVVHNSYSYSGRRVNYPCWYYSAPLQGNNSLELFDTAQEIPGWGTDNNFKTLEIGRYYRSVQFMESSTPEVKYKSAAIYRVESGGTMTLLKVIDSWTDSSGNTKTYDSFWSGGNNSISVYSAKTDPSGGLFSRYSSTQQNGNTGFVRIVHFAAERDYIITQPEDKSTPSVQRADNITLTVEPFSGPDGYEVTGSHWEVFNAADVSDGIYEGKTPVYEADIGYVEGAAFASAVNDYSSHTLNRSLPEGSYTWRMFYRYQIGGAGSMGQRGTSQWSEPSELNVTPASSNTVNEPETNNESAGESKGGGGCNSGVSGMIALVCIAVLTARRK